MKKIIISALVLSGVVFAGNGEELVKEYMEGQSLILNFIVQK